MMHFAAFCRKHALVIAGALLILTVRFGYLGVVYNHESGLSRSLFRVFAPKDLRTAPSAAYRFGYDSRKFELLASQVASGEPMHYGAPEDIMVAPPGYPVLLGIFYFLFGKSFVPILVFTALLDVCTAFLILSLVRPLTKAIPYGEPLLLAGFALFIPYVTTIMMPLTEGLFTFLLALFFRIYSRPDGNHSVGTGLAAGLVLGLAALTRPIALLFPGWLLVYGLYGKIRSGSWRGMIRPLLVIAGLTAAVSPWIIRNHIRYDQFILISTSGRSSMASATETARGNELTEKDTAGRTLWGIALEAGGGMVRHPLRTAGELGTKFIRLWFNLGYPRGPSPGSALTALLHLVIMCLAGVSVYRDRRILTRFTVPFLFILHVSFFHILLFTPRIRYIMPLMPYLLFAAGICLLQFRRQPDRP